ncbi:hypothetical protein V2I01_25415 [Micromonospora sp. BRA006-A]|nr:hypothetical protein [Micromonospora sp. BRA006-A]
MSAAGVTNAFADLTGSWGDTSWETVTDRNPEVIVLVDASWIPPRRRRPSSPGTAPSRTCPRSNSSGTW